MVESPIVFEYLPNYAVPPGETLNEVLAERTMSRSELARCAALSPEQIDRIIDGEVQITADVAVCLERATSIPARLWLDLENIYRERLSRLDESTLQSDLPLLDELPIAWMVKNGILTKRLGRLDRLREVLIYLGVVNREEWIDSLHSLEASFRMSKAHRCDPAAVAVWLRMGEIDAAEIECDPWDEARFRKALRQIRALTQEPDPDVWHPRLIELCAGAGVAVVTVPEVSGARINGAARWMTATKGLIQLSIRGRWSDIFWFSFFHEACHILDQTKQPIFLSGKNKDSPEEQRADQFAQNFSIPPHRTRACSHYCGGFWYDRGMNITEEQYELVADCFPVQRGNVKVSNLQVLNGILYVAEHGCKWRGLPSRFGRWHTVYTRMNRWSKNGVLDRVFERLQQEQIVRVKVETVSMDSTIVKVHPDGTGARKKGVRNRSGSPGAGGPPRFIWLPRMLKPR